MLPSELKLCSCMNKLRRSIVYGITSSSTPLLAYNPAKGLFSNSLIISSQLKYHGFLKPFASTIEHKHFLSTSHHCSRKKGSFKKFDSLDDDDDDDEEEKEEDIIFGDKKHTKVFQATSTRIDLLLKNAFGYSRKTVDEAFYESRVMLNGKKVTKKGDLMKLGDEADIVHGYNSENPKFLMVSRIELKSVEVVDEDNPEQGIRIKLIRHKNIKVPNYNPPWKSSTPES